MTASDWIQALSDTSLSQGHLVEYLKTKPKDLVDKVVNQLQRVEDSYPGGVVNYIVRSKQFVAAAIDGKNAFEGYRAEVPLAVKVDPETDPERFLALEEIGLADIDKVAFVLVAGGLGERLGYPDIKVSLPTEVVTMTSYLNFYIEHINAIQNYAERKGKKSDFQIPFAIMCSEDTYAPTKELLEENDHFGFRGTITLMMQEKVPAICNGEAKFYVDEEGLQTKPHGHGDVHSLLVKHRLPKQWLDEGRSHMFFFQDTNALVFKLLPALLGSAIEQKLTMNSVTVARLPKENVGAVCKLTKDETQLTLNVEYNQLAPLLEEMGLGGDVAGADGKSPFPGNTNCLLFDLCRYSAVMETTGGNIPEFINPKFSDPSRTAFKSPTRLECMMQEFPRLLSKEDAIGCITAPRWLCFSTVKNSNEDAKAKLLAKNTPECAFSGESDLYNSNTRLLQLAADIAKVGKCEIAGPKKSTWMGIEYPIGPKLVIKPNFAFCLTEMVERLRNCERIELGQNAQATLDMSDDLISLADGKIQFKDCTKDFTQSHSFREATEADPTSLKIRGYAY